HGQPVPLGVSGEIHIGGAGVARGYLNRPELTAERFIADPFSEQAGARMYKTGDLGRWLADGNIEYLGRNDFQVKIRGFRIELGEIEAKLAACAGVREAVVLAREDVAGDKRLVAYLVLNAGVALEPADLRSHLSTSLAEHMLPSAFVTLDVLPLTPNGKLDRKALPTPDGRALVTREYEAPQGELEIQLVAIWADILSLEVEEIGLKDSFFGLGGHSLLVSPMLMAVKKNLAQDIALARFIETPTIAALSLLLKESSLPKGTVIAPRVYSDAELPVDISPLPTANPRLHQPDRVLLTGANGFLGCFILEQLLQQTRAQVVCLVRAGNDEQAQGRLNKALADLGLVALIDHPRILALAGDLRKLQLGLSTSRFDELASTVDVIYHNGAHVNHLYDYNYLYAANVGSTLSLLRLACTGQNKAMHFVSTLSSASCINAAGELEEAGPVDTPPPGFADSGYCLSKWVSERLVWQAASRGMTAAIYRPGNITGHSQLGTCLPDHNRLLRMVKG
ncbi:thioester reductase domain-containing protein, partial [Neisseriaceae bacterium TC5R-5]|nr:thioester reductase domain-containing protein [Neisseriaceae bacterium TC5R-5]